MTSQSSAPFGLRERKKQLTRQALVDAARSLFFERGYDNVSVADVACAANTSVTTLFHYFESKEDLAFADEYVLRDQMIAAVLSRRRSESVLDAVGAALDEYLCDSTTFQIYEAAKTYRRCHGESVALRNRLRRMWADYEDALTDAILASSDFSPSVARLRAMQAIALARSATTEGATFSDPAQVDPRAAMRNWLATAMQILGGDSRARDDVVT
jgi:AcrR family transcriptional regulator